MIKGRPGVAPVRALRNWLQRQRTFRVERGPAAGIRMCRAFASADYAPGGNELPVQHAIRSALLADQVFYDIGANVGFFSLLAAKAVGPNGAVYAFEALPAIASTAKRNVDLNELTQVTVFPYAVSDRNGTTTIQETMHPGGATLVDAGHPEDTIRRLNVETVTLDSAIERWHLRPPNVVKIDVEGAEPAVLSGMTATLASVAPKLILELDAAREDELETKTAGLRSQLASLGYGMTELERAYEDAGWNVRHFLCQRET